MSFTPPQLGSPHHRSPQPPSPQPLVPTPPGEPPLTVPDAPLENPADVRGVLRRSARVPLAKEYTQLLQVYELTAKDHILRNQPYGRMAFDLCALIEKHLTIGFQTDLVAETASGEEADATTPRSRSIVSAMKPQPPSTPYTGPQRDRAGTTIPHHDARNSPVSPTLNSASMEPGGLPSNLDLTEDAESTCSTPVIGSEWQSQVVTPREESFRPLPAAAMDDVSFNISYYSAHGPQSTTPLNVQGTPVNMQGTPLANPLPVPRTRGFDQSFGTSTGSSRRESTTIVEWARGNESANAIVMASSGNSVRNSLGGSANNAGSLNGPDRRPPRRTTSPGVARHASCNSTSVSPTDSKLDSHLTKQRFRGPGRRCSRDDGVMNGTQNKADKQSHNPSREDGLLSCASNVQDETRSRIGLSYAGSFYGRPAAAVTLHLHKTVDDAGFKMINQYTVLDFVGAGTSGKVKSVQSTTDNEMYAVKIVKRKKFRLCAQDLHAEAAIMISLHHKHIVPLVEVIDDPSSHKVYMVMPYIDGGPIVQYTRDGQCPTTPEDQLQKLLRQLIGGLSYLHSKGILHCDIKPDNLLMSQDGTVYIADFGSSSFFTAQRTGASGSGLGTPRFMAPEMHLCTNMEDLGPSVDVWSLGVVVFSMLFGHHPFWETSVDATRDRVLTEDLIVPTNAGVSVEGQQLVARLLERDPSKRITLAELRHHPWTRKRALRR